jgi:hypothetical protein
MIHIKVKRNKIYKEYLQWLNPILGLSKGEIDVMASYMTLHYMHKDYDKKVLTSLLLSEQTKEGLRKHLKINTRLFNKLFGNLMRKGLITEEGINKNLMKYPDNNKLKMFICLEIEK